MVEPLYIPSLERRVKRQAVVEQAGRALSCDSTAVTHSTIYYIMSLYFKNINFYIIY